MNFVILVDDILLKLHCRSVKEALINEKKVVFLLHGTHFVSTKSELEL